MDHESQQEHDTDDSPYKRVVRQDGLCAVYFEARFEISIHPLSDINEQIALQAFRAWIKGRKEQEKLRDSGNLPG
jgi:hypothetical protein